jgi:hypothetical protein
LGKRECYLLTITLEIKCYCLRFYLLYQFQRHIIADGIVKHLPSKCKFLSSKPSPTKKFPFIVDLSNPREINKTLEKATDL